MPEITTSLRIPNYASNPSSPTTGQVFYNTTNNTVYFYNGTTWLPARVPAGGTTSQVLQKIDATDFNTQWTTLAGGGNVSNTGTPTSGQIASWTSATVIQGTQSVRLNPRVTTSTTSNTTPTPNADTDDVYIATGMTVNMVFGAPTGTPVNGQLLTIRIKDNGTSRTIGWNAIYASSQAIGPSSTVAGKTTTIKFVYDSALVKWMCFNVDIESAQCATLLTNPGNPTGTTNTTGVMMGFNGIITPKISGRVMVTITGVVANTVSGSGAFASIRYGQAASGPANGAALTGTQIGSDLGYWSGAPGASFNTAICCMAAIGMTPNLPWWIDLQLRAVVSGTATISNVYIAAVEVLAN